MNSTEKRRKQLLEQTRNMYSDKRNIPVIHPRYGSTYGYLYGREEGEERPETLGIRFILCLMLFAAFISMDKQEREVFHMDSGKIVEEITTNLDIAEVWKEL